GITAVIQHGGGAVDVERRLGGVRRADDLRGRRAVLAMDGEVGPRVAQYPQVHIQHRAAPAHVAPVRHLARENRVAAGDGVAHADQVVDANVLEHDERGNFTVGEVALEIALPSGQGNLVRLEPVQPGAIPTHLDPVYPQLLVPGVESDLDATGIAEHRRRDGFVNEVDMALAAVHSAVDLHVIQPVAPTPIGRARRGGIPLRRDLTWLDERRDRRDRETELAAAEFHFARARPPRCQQGQHPEQMSYQPRTPFSPASQATTGGRLPRRIDDGYQLRAASAATAGNSLPARNSRNAPPPVEM